jgi:hypothetical protein
LGTALPRQQLPMYRWYPAGPPKIQWRAAGVLALPLPSDSLPAFTRWGTARRAPASTPVPIPRPSSRMLVLGVRRLLGGPAEGGLSGAPRFYSFPPQFGGRGAESTRLLRPGRSCGKDLSCFCLCRILEKGILVAARKCTRELAVRNRREIRKWRIENGRARSTPSHLLLKAQKAGHPAKVLAVQPVPLSIVLSSPPSGINSGTTGTCMVSATRESSRPNEVHLGHKCMG